MTTNQSWLNQFDAVKEKIEWIFDEHDFQTSWEKLLEYRVQNDKTNMQRVLSRVWYLLPDEVFNIRNNPKGWNEFLSLIED